MRASAAHPAVATLQYSPLSTPQAHPDPVPADTAPDPRSPDAAPRFDPRHPLALGLAAMRAYFVPGLILWAAGLAIVLAYFFAPPVQSWLDRVGALKHSLGVWYSIPALAFFAGFLPFCLQALSADRRRTFALSQLAFLVVFWGIKGAEVDLLYRLQVVLFGDNRAPLTVVQKVAVDQFVYVPLWAIPSTVLPYLWANKGFRLGPVREALGGRWYRDLVLPVMLGNWMVWIPAVSLIYLFPEPLQLPMQNIIACLWACMMLFMGHAEAAAMPDVTDE